LVNIAQAESLEGWMSTPELYFLAENAKDHKKIVEAGCYYGRSTRALCDNAAGIVYAVDPWSGNYGVNASRDGTPFAYSFKQPMVIFNQFIINLYDHVISNKCIIQPMEFSKFNPVEPVDMVFIDAIHDYDNVKQDIKHALGMLGEGGLLCGHDYSESWPGVIKAVDEVFGDGKVGVEDTIWWIRPKL
jgi:Methyltransferase domain